MSNPEYVREFWLNYISIDPTPPPPPAPGVLTRYCWFNDKYKQRSLRSFPGYFNRSMVR